MKKRVISTALTTVFVAGMAGLAAATETAGRWIHVRILDRGEKQESVKVNMPLPLLETVASVIEDKDFKDGHVRLGDSDLDADQVRALWQAVRSSQDMEFVTVESDDETVRVAKSGNFLLAKIRGNADGGKSGEKVEVKIPLDVVDALLSAPKGELNVKAALQALAAHGGGDLVVIHDDDSDVRIWIDDRSAAE